MKRVAIVVCIVLGYLGYYCKAQDLSSIGALPLISSQLAFLKYACDERTDNSTVFEEVQTLILECQENILNGTNLTYISLTNTDPKEYYEFYNKQCYSQEFIKERVVCNERMKSLMKQCLNKTELKAFERIENIAIRLNIIICDLEEDKIKHFFSNSGQECLADNVFTIGFCFLQALPDDDQERNEFLFSLMEGRNKDCDFIDEIQECAMNELKLCEERTVYQIFQLIFDFFQLEFKCVLEDSINEINISEVVYGGSSIIKFSIAVFLLEFFTYFL